MMNWRFISTNWFIGLFLTVLVLAAFLFEFYPLQIFEYKTYDVLTSLRKKGATNTVVIVGVDDKSIRTIGPWPWPRSNFADLIKKLTKSGAKIIGMNMLYQEKELNDGLREIRNIRKEIEKNRKVLRNRSVAKVYKSLKKAEGRLNNDWKLSSALKSSRKVVLPFRFTLGEMEKEKRSRIPSYLKKNSLLLKTNSHNGKKKKRTFTEKSKYITATEVTPPFPGLAAQARALGHTNHVADRDQTVRSEPLLILYRGRLFPSFALQIALKYFNFSTWKLQYVEDTNGFSGLKIGNMKIPTWRDSRMLISYNGKEKTFPSYSVSDVLNNKIPAKAFKNKIVLIGLTSDRIAHLYKTPVQKRLPEIEITANIVENIFSGNHLIRPPWASALEIGVLLYFGIFISFIIPKVRKSVSLLIIGIFLFTWCGISILLFLKFGYWLKMFSPVLLCFMGSLAIVSQRYIFIGKGKLVADTESIESYKMLGLSFQGQGMLDMAFEKFIKCPVQDSSVKGLLYNLGLDFERKRMFTKSVSVYEHILKGGRYKDIKERIKKLKNVGDTVIFSKGTTNAEKTMLLEDMTTKPTLGRYEVLKELGRGAMGTVYRGSDPKINREVAIKTLRYDEMNDEQIAEFKERFFREAEAAGTLSHPNIVTVYDVGEEHDMAYIAMELLPGKDLSAYNTKKNLLPVKEVLRIVASVAEALDYAHSKGVVHRDIKPANIMLLKNGSVKVTDFGIARVMATSSTQTQTGVVLGTPSYMSPEQISAKNVDGRSDLFSLGSVFYELLSGEKPFKGDNIAALMHSISNSEYEQVRKLVSKVPECCDKILSRLLAKSPKKRYRSGRDVANDVNQCLEKLG